MGKPIADMSVEELREEVWYWREHTACLLSMTLRQLGDKDAARLAARLHRDPRERLRNEAQVLHAALENRYHPTCEACGKAVKPGQLVVRFEDVDEMHARCAGATDEQAVEGGRIPVDADMLSLDEGEAPPADPAMTVYASEPLYTEEKVAELAAEGMRVWLGHAQEPTR